MEKYIVVMSNQAEKELSNIITYISSVLLEPNIAKNLLKKLTNTIDKLETLPERYSISLMNTLLEKIFTNVLSIIML